MIQMKTPPLRDAILRHLTYSFGKDPEHAILEDWRMALSYAVRDRIVDAWFKATGTTYDTGAKRVYYLSMEFLIGRLLEDGIVNLELVDEAKSALAEFSKDYHEVLADEPDAALGNGGLGRLAACFLESLSTIGCPAHGYGIRYEHGLFRQSFVDGRQIEQPELWLSQRHAWEFERPEVRYRIGFGGHVTNHGETVRWHPAEEVEAEAFDTPIVGWKGRWANTLRLWSGRAIHPFDLDAFNHGDYARAAAPEALARTISRVLYPDDTTEQGKELRLKQEYFLTGAALRDILRRFDNQFGDIRKLPEKVAIQLNDTHPAIAGPELVRILHDERGLPFDDAVEIARGTLSYTNHTLLPEALESWDESLFGRLLPRHIQLIDQIDYTHAQKNPSRTQSMRADHQVKMGQLSFVMAHHVNGVSALHTELMKTTVFEELHRLHPDRIVNETNGVTPRRWLLACNPALAGLITESIGESWVDDLEQLERLEPHIQDSAWLDRYAQVKRENKVELSNWMGQTYGLHADPDMLFDVQIKRMHEYKRQHLNILEAIAHWQEIRENPDAGWTPRLKLFAGKAAPGYFFAKDIIRLINDAATVINADPVTNKYLKIAFLPNYNVTLAERLVPAADLSEQISTAGKEASGTGNMKFALNGAPTVGTLDGANVEIREHVGAENFFLFGMTAEEVMERRTVESHARKAIEADPRLAAALKAVREGRFSPSEPDRYRGIADNLEGADYFLVCSDFTDYWRAQREVDAAFKDTQGWARMAAFNTARSGWFSSDRTIRGYMHDIWNAKSLLQG
ncbi:MAG: glycogen/starch/alpha-glucan phosphorylase [Rhodobacteraceae bacterium]|jgi:starch phosphorylase|uniref:Alpha-1,4 glucan phosphorylase n=1 Tax=Salipiger profundus TaxID=1229727 RepID=A0A1U7D9I5_9RHOB|nr:MULTISPECIES: glycogen/starch/alpha-glucan phosphorylase [Salipiger]APX24793.1 starch phosphorylase [Salipiger profundus]MAB07711.1 glycogen/starch/alpha-glucan phosphorylase [Paracoccaceae bacterium]GFZ97862.1 alpha-1,4 glucan phosphorylase [Salipiger profundus]SFC99086.1 starch phosphorylase [Salipiger profundus]